MPYRTVDLRNVDGVLCVREVTADKDEPVFIIRYYPTKFTTNQFMREYETALDVMTIYAHALPGCYLAIFPKLIPDIYIDLANGAQTKFIKEERQAMNKPPTRGKKIDYWGGKWWRANKQWTPIEWREIEDKP